MADFYYRPGKEGSTNQRKAKDSEPTLNGQGTEFNNGKAVPVVVSNFSAGFGGNKSSSQAYLFASVINRKDSKVDNIDTVDESYPGQDIFGVEDTFQYVYSASPNKLKISIYR